MCVGIVPVAIKGSRQILRGDARLLWPGEVTVTFSPKILPQGNDWAAVSQLKTKTRTEIAKHCGEYPIDLIAAGPGPTK